jgi:predicted benzoate:H+ symporter BenE
VSQGYRVPVDRVTVVVGLGPVLNALFGGHPAVTSRSGIPVVAGPDAGPKAGSYWASLMAGALSLLIALAARPLAALLGILPATTCSA